MIYIIRDEKDIVRLLKIICLCALLNSALGVVEFYFKHRFLVDVFPKSMLAALAESNPMLQTLVDGTGRGGMEYSERHRRFLFPSHSESLRLSLSLSHYSSLCIDRICLKGASAGRSRSAELSEYSFPAHAAAMSVFSPRWGRSSPFGQFARRSVTGRAWRRRSSAPWARSRPLSWSY